MAKFFLCLFVLALSRYAAAGEVLIEVAMADDGGFFLTYTLPSGVTELKRTRIDEVSDAFWKQHVRSLDDCAQIESTRIVLRSSPMCRSARLQVQAVLLDRYAHYEAALPMVRQGVLGFTGYYLAAISGHGLRWRWLPPAGGYVLHQGQLHREAVEQVLSDSDVAAALKALDKPESWQRLGAQQYVYLGRAPTMTVPGGTLVHDSTLDKTRLDIIEQTLALAMQSLGTSYHQWPAGPVGVVVTTAESAGFRGDVTQGRMMSLRLPRVPDSNQSIAQIQRFIAHEVAHWWNMGIFSSDNRQPWLHEGHAEWAALLLMRSRDLMSRDQAGEQLEAAINRCISVRGDRSAATLNANFGRGDDPYACGLTLMFVAQTHHEHQKKPKQNLTALDTLATLHTQDRELSVSEFAAWADGASAGPMRRLLLDPAQPFEDGLSEMIRTLGLGQARSIDAINVLPESVAIGLAESLVKALMASDCGGAAGFWRQPDGFKLDERVTCHSLRLGQDVLALNGVSMLRDSARAWKALTDACAANDSTTAKPLSIQYRNGPATELACPKPIPSMPFKHIISLEKSVAETHGI